ncbi:MAG: hypothetical protein HC851_04030 [Acaryochloris sp. RU_4_1]|nr:hypothetical protein [Acaryochloris sp. RU_4_1]NJR55158.1 hypothetical protein [Acaryochloris sp. CRU_2_0]
MFKDVRFTPNSDINQAKGSKESPSAQVKLSADELMDALFHDIEVHLDNSLDGNSTALSTAVYAKSGQALLGNSREKGLIRRRRSPADLEDDLLVPYTPMDSTLVGHQGGTASLNVASELRVASSIGRGRLLISTACVSLVGITMFWLGRQLRLQQAPVVAASSSAAVTASPIIKPEVIEFADYVTRSLQLIDQETKTAKLAAATPGLSPSGLPSLPNAPQIGVTSPNVANALPNNVERVYVPVADVPVPTLKAKIPAPPQLLAAVQTSSQADALPALKPLPMTPPKGGERKFLGGTNLGDQPVFMVSINGSTRQVKLGEAIDETGAAFVQFDGEQSVLKQGSQLRSVTAGQSF